jgi:tetratricopeptide (TPR) repeat protein
MPESIEAVVDRLQGREVAFTGRLASLTRKEAAELVRAFGGVFVLSPGRRTSFLVIGQEGWPLREDGRLTRKLMRAMAFQSSGRPISIIPEEEFLSLLGLTDRRDDIRRLFTAGQLCRILEFSRDRLRLWLRAGLVHPSRTVGRLAYFDFRQVAAARTLSDLIRSGVGVDRIRRSLLALKAWNPDFDACLAQLCILEREGELLVRLEDGRVAETNGQLLFDFAWTMDGNGSGGSIAPFVDFRPRTPEGWFDLALRREDAGRLEEAAEAYREALLLEDRRPETYFNLGNVLYSLGRREEAAGRFRDAVALDGEYVEAWNNLGNALSDIGRADEAIEAFRRALAVEPTYPDAHFNLAEVLHGIGREDEARRHWTAYLREDPRSRWAEKVRSRLA